MAKKAKVEKPTKVKKPRKAKEPAQDAAAPDAKGSVPQDNVPKADPEMRALARKHRDDYAKLRKRMGDVQRDMRKFGKTIKADGFTLRQIALMIELSTPEGEAAWRMTIANDLIAAQYQGAAIGQQLTLFLEPDRTPSVDIAYDEGVQDCMDGKAPKPGYDPSVPQHAQYLKGYHDETERRVKKGIGSDVKPNPSRADTIAAARAANEAPAAGKLN